MTSLMKFLLRANEAEIMHLTALMEASANNEKQIFYLLKRYE